MFFFGVKDSPDPKFTIQRHRFAMRNGVQMPHRPLPHPNTLTPIYPCGAAAPPDQRLGVLPICVPGRTASPTPTSSPSPSATSTPLPTASGTPTGTHKPRATPNATGIFSCSPAHARQEFRDGVGWTEANAQQTAVDGHLVAFSSWQRQAPPPPPPRSLARAVNSRQHSVLIWFVLQWQQGKPLCKQGTE